MTPFIPAIVIPVGPGREENLRLCLEHIGRQAIPPRGVVVVFDGPDAQVVPPACGAQMVTATLSQPHSPGQEQPRNVGVRVVTDYWPECNAVWFLDSDVIVVPDALERLREAWEMCDEERVVMAPYDWLPPGMRQLAPHVRNDPRWPMIDEPRFPAESSRAQLNVGLGCFSGNLVWPINEFIRIGGFWNEIHHGRCEDGELGLRAVALAVPITACAAARGFHLHHEVNHELATQRNARDVPMLNARHPWVEGEGVFVVERDGRRFEQRCGKCGQLVNTIEWWAHYEHCAGGVVASAPGGAESEAPCSVP